jgi:hypothetical protein
LEAVRWLKHEAIECRVLDGLSADLTPSERAAHHAERKALYLKLHPQTKHGAAPGAGRGHGKKKRLDKSQNENYVKAAAKKTGKGRSTVARDVARAEAIDPKALADLRGTCLDKGDQLDALAKMPKAEQRKLAARAKAGEKVSAKTKVKALHRADREKKLAKKITALPNQKFGVIYADPEWQMIGGRRTF